MLIKFFLIVCGLVHSNQIFSEYLIIYAWNLQNWWRYGGLLDRYQAISARESNRIMNDKRIIEDTSIDSKEIFFLSRVSVLDKSLWPEILPVDDLFNIEASFSIILFMSELNLI